jgi:D-tyrosyl-tRNA(Tyr) deacylase
LKAVVQRVAGARGSSTARRSAEIGAASAYSWAWPRRTGREEPHSPGGQGRAPADLRERAGKFDLSLLDTGGEALVVSQFTLIADTARGTGRTSPRGAAAAARAALRELLRRARSEGSTCAAGVFGARMEVELVNDGPVTIVLET